MNIDVLVLGNLQNNCYIIKKGDICMIIDPSCNAQLIKEKCKGLKVVEILVTHHHFDHVGALEELENTYNIKHNTFPKIFNYEIIKTPGHSSDSITFYFKDEKIMFTGDFLFYHTIGRCDLPTGNIEDMQKSLKQISKYPDDIKIYPGHGKNTILGEEKKFFSHYF